MRYRLALRDGLGPKRSDGDVEGQVARYQLAQELEAHLVSAVKATLCSRGAPLLLFPVYVNFARHVAKVCRRYGGKTRFSLVNMAVDRWAAYGLSRELLLELFHSHFQPYAGPDGYEELPGAEGESS